MPCQLQQPPVVEISTALTSSRVASKQFVQCTKCGRTNAPEARFCDWCGTKVRLWCWLIPSKKGKGFPYLLPSVGPEADPGVQAVSPQVTISHPPGGRLPLLSARPAVTFPAAHHHRPLACTKLYCLVTGAHSCEQLAQGCYTDLPK